VLTVKGLKCKRAQVRKIAKNHKKSQKCARFERKFTKNADFLAKFEHPSKSAQK